MTETTPEEDSGITWDPEEPGKERLGRLSTGLALFMVRRSNHDPHSFVYAVADIRDIAGRRCYDYAEQPAEFSSAQGAMWGAEEYWRKICQSLGVVQLGVPLYVPTEELEELRDKKTRVVLSPAERLTLAILEAFATHTNRERAVRQWKREDAKRRRTPPEGGEQ